MGDVLSPKLENADESDEDLIRKRSSAGCSRPRWSRRRRPTTRARTTGGPPRSAAASSTSSCPPQAHQI